MIEEILNYINNLQLKEINFKDPTKEDVHRLHSIIVKNENTLIYRYLYFLTASKAFGLCFVKEIEVDITSSKDCPSYEFLSKLIQEKSNRKDPIIKAKLSKKENMLLGLIKEAKYTREQLILNIYGEQQDYLKSQASFKSLIYRFKKKIDIDIFISTNGIYSFE